MKTILSLLFVVPFLCVSSSFSQDNREFQLGPIEEVSSSQLKGFVFSQPAVPVSLGTSRSPEIVSMIKRVKGAIGRLTAFQGGEEIGLGTAFFIGSDRIISNNHVLKGADSAAFVAGEQNFKVTGVEKFHPARDQVILKVNQESKVSLKVNNIAPDLAESIWVIGNPLGYDGTVSDGIVSGVRKDLLQITAPISPGNSGGPILTREGEVLGVATYTLKDAQNMNFGYRILSDGWVFWNNPVSLEYYNKHMRLKGQKEHFPVLEEVIDNGMGAIVSRYSKKEQVFEAHALSRFANVDLEKSLAFLLDQDAVALTALQSLKKILQAPSVDHGDAFVAAVGAVFTANDSVIFRLCALHGMDQNAIDSVVENGGSLSVPAENWDVVINEISEVRASDAKLLEQLLMCNFVVGVYVANW